MNVVHLMVTAVHLSCASTNVIVHHGAPLRCGQDPSVAEAAGAALMRVQRMTSSHVAVLTNCDYLANPRAVLEAKLPLLTQEVRLPLSKIA